MTAPVYMYRYRRSPIPLTAASAALVAKEVLRSAESIAVLLSFSAGLLVSTKKHRLPS